MPNLRIVLSFKVYMAKSRKRNLRTRRTKRRRVGGLFDRSLINLIRGDNSVKHPEQKRTQCKQKFNSIEGDPKFHNDTYQEWYDEYKRDHHGSKDVDLICGKVGDSYHKNTRYRPKQLDGIGGELYKFFKEKQEKQDSDVVNERNFNDNFNR